MSISFNSIRGYKNKVNLGDAGYNSNVKYNKNKIYSGGNPTNWDGQHNIQKDPSKSTHTRFVEKVGSEIISNMNRNEDVFKDRIQENINHYPTGRNVMATGIDYGGNPYKIGDSSKTCKFNVGDYVSLTNNYPLSRIPVQYVQTTTNKKKQENFQTSINRNPNLKSIKDNYLTSNVNTNKKEKYSYNNNNLNDVDVNKNIRGDRLHYQISSNLIRENNYNNLSNRHVDTKILNENYRMVNTNVNKTSNITRDNVDRHKINTQQSLNENYRISNVTTNLRRNYNELDRQNRNIKLQSKLRVNEGYDNNRQGIRKQTTNLNFRL